MKEQQYTIGELSRMFDLPSSTLRYYEEIGVLGAVEKNKAGQRCYTKEHVDRLHAIHCFKQAGMTLGQLKQLFEYEVDEAAHIDDIIGLLADQEQRVQEQMRQLELVYGQICRKVEYYKEIKAAMEEGRPRPCWDWC